MVWVINSNSNTCRIYKYHKPSSSLDLITEISHPENKTKTSELVTDKPGKFQANHSSRGSYEPANGPKDIMIDSFLRNIANEINAGRTKNLFSKLIIIAPPHVDGILMQHMDKHVKDMVICSIQKDLLKTNEKELLKVLDDTPNY